MQGEPSDGNAGRYEPLGEVARGGMGVVLKVKDRTLDRTLAMKRMLSAPDLSGGEAEVDRFARFMEEAHVTAQLDHPGIVPVHDLGEDGDGCAYYTMKLVRGRELGEVIKRARRGGGSWSLPRLVGVLVRACQAVAFAHGKGVIHRDIKPANIMVGDLGEVYVMDWGLARQLDREDLRDIRLKVGGGAARSGMETIVSPRRADSNSSIDAPLMTMDGAVVGTPAYMPPEQAAGIVDQVDHLSDIYSLGAVLYEILASRSPYMEGGGRTSPSDVLTALSNGPPTPVRRVRPDAPAELVAICEKAMSRAREDRYETCLELADDLQAFLDGRVVRAYETGRFAEFKKLLLRNKATSAAAAVAVATLAALAIVQAISNRRLGDSLANEEAARSEATLALADMLRNTGLKEPDPARAALWFAKAAEVAATDPGRSAANRQRCAAWSRRAAEPVRAFRSGGGDAGADRLPPRRPSLPDPGWLRLARGLGLRARGAVGSGRPERGRLQRGRAVARGRRWNRFAPPASPRFRARRRVPRAEGGDRGRVRPDGPLRRVWGGGGAPLGSRFGGGGRRRAVPPPEPCPLAGVFAGWDAPRRARQQRALPVRRRAAWGGAARAPDRAQS